MSVSLQYAIKCPFKEKDQAKELGARWNKDYKLWYAPSKEVYELLSKWHDKDSDVETNPPTPPSTHCIVRTLDF